MEPKIAMMSAIGVSTRSSDKTERLQNRALNLSELKNENQALMKRNNMLSEDNEMLRKKIMKINSFKLED